jgi:hypothetical protein
MDDAGKPAGVRESTDRIHTEQRLRIAQQAGHVGTFEWYPESGRLDVSEEHRRIWGLSPEVAVTDDLLASLIHQGAALSRVHPSLIWPIRLNMPNTGGSIR